MASTVTIEGHLQRASELGVTLEEYAEAYDVELGALQTADSRSVDPLADFVQVAVVNDPAPAGVVLCRLVHRDGWSLECQQWPPAAWLRSLREVMS